MAKKVLKFAGNPGMMLVFNYLALLAVNWLVLYIAHLWFPQNIVLGNASLSAGWAMCLSMSKLALIGTLAIPLAGKVRHVTALDYSAAMLGELNKQAKTAGRDNITTVQASWTDDWQALGIPRHEVAIASRSLSVDDLKGALRKLNGWASKAVYVVDRVGAGPFDPDLFGAIGRDFEPGPDYIFTLNILYTLGIQARVDFLTLDSTRTYGSREEALQSYRWMVDDLTFAEEERLAAYVDARLRQTADHAWQLARQTPPRWALIWWRTDG